MIDYASLSDRRVALLLSGGVDSAVAAHELASHGIRPDCFYINIGPEDNADTRWDCSAEEDLEMARSVARKYDLKIEVVDCHRDYWDRVTAYTMDKVRQGLTPNPDVMCNRLVKFGAFHEKRGHDYDYIATGHYAQTERDDEGLTWLTTSPDPVKDQTDFLAQIDDWQLQKALFPIGHYAKGEVRRVAANEHLAPAHRRDSQGICFLGKISYTEYLRRYLGEQQGPIVELETGRQIGTHRGHWFHTIGQRKGLGLGGGPWFIVGKNPAQNTLYVSHGYDPATAYRDTFDVVQMHWLTKPVATSNVTIKIRHTPEWQRATMTPSASDARYTFTTETPLHGVAPGQFCVVYDEHHHRCLGSGEIAWNGTIESRKVVEL